MHPDDESTARRPDGSTDLKFAALVRALAREDPRFVRRCSVPRRRVLPRVDLLIVVGLVGTLLLGVVPLAIGVSLQAVGLLVVGATGCLVMPVAGPVLVRAAIVRHRPLWT